MKKSMVAAIVALCCLIAVALPPQNVEAKKRNVMKDVRYCKDLGMFDGSIKHINLSKKITEEKAVQYIYNIYYDPLQRAISRGFEPYAEALADDIIRRMTDDPKGYYGISPVYDIAGTPYYWSKDKKAYVSSSGEIYPDYDGYFYNSNGRRFDEDYYYNRRGGGSSAWQWAESIGIVDVNDRPHKTATHRWFYGVLSDFAYYIDGYDTTFRNRNSGKVKKGDAARIMRLFAENRLDPDSLGRDNRYYDKWYW